MECYLDNAATTKVTEGAIQVMEKVMREDYGNPSSRHRMGSDAQNYVEKTRKVIAKALKCEKTEIVLTSGGTESNNLALLGIARANKRSGKHIISTQIEHASVYNPLLALEKEGYEITFLGTDTNGLVSCEDLRSAIRPDTILVSIMMVNNEVGAIEPIEAIAKVISEVNSKTYFHVDAIQGFGKLSVYPKRLHIDALSMSGHKLHGPKGTGFLYLGERVKILPEILGGGQQKGMRSGTENVPGFAGLGEAITEYLTNQKENNEHMYEIKTYFIERLAEVEGAKVNALYDELADKLSLPERVRKTAPHIVSVSFDIDRSEVLLHALEEKGIYVSSGSACSSNHPAISGTLKAIKVPDKYLDATLRFSFSELTTKEEIDYTVDCLKEILPVLQKYKRA